MSELDAVAVARALAELRRLYVPETVDEGRRRLAREGPRPVETLAETAARGLAELRALCELTDHLHRVRVPRR